MIPQRDIQGLLMLQITIVHDLIEREHQLAAKVYDCLLVTTAFFL